jgi:hypothetical protein
MGQRFARALARAARGAGGILTLLDRSVERSGLVLRLPEDVALAAPTLGALISRLEA